MDVAWGSASFLSSHGRGIKPQDASKKNSRGLSRGEGKLGVALESLHPMDCSLPGSFIHGIFQAKVVEWGVLSHIQLFATHGL